MSISKAFARIACAASRGDWADLEQFPEADRVLPARVVRDLLLAHPLCKDDHEAIAKLEPEYAPFVPREVFAPVLIAAPGLRIRGLTVRGILDLSDCTGSGGLGLPALALENCRLEGEGKSDAEAGIRARETDVMTCLDLTNAKLAQLSLKDSRTSFVRARECALDGPLDISGIGPIEGWEAQPWPGVNKKIWRKWMSDRAEWLNKKITAERWNKAFADTEPEEPQPLDPQRLPPWPTSSTQHCWLDFTGSRIDGRVTADGATLRTPPARKDIPPSQTRYALRLAESDITGSIDAVQSAVFEGGLSIAAARIECDCWFRDLTIRAGEGEALDGLATRVRGLFLFDQNAAAWGQVTLTEAEISKSIWMECAFLNSAGKAAFTAQRLNVGGDVKLGRLAAVGQITLERAMISGNLEMAGAQIKVIDDFALKADGLDLAGTAFFIQRFNSLGGLSLKGAKILADLEFFSMAVEAKQYAVLAFGADIGGRLWFHNNQFDGAIGLKNVTARVLADSANGYRGAWYIELEGFAYQRLESPEPVQRTVSIAAYRTAWLDRQGAFYPGTFAHLARVLQQQGYPDDARDILVVKHKKHLDRARALVGWRARPLNLPRSAARSIMLAFSSIFGLLFGFGFKTSNTLATLAVAFLAGWVFFAGANHFGLMVVDQQPVAGVLDEGRPAIPISVDPSAANVRCGDAIRPSLYALDVFIPLVDLRQETKCEVGLAPDAASPWKGITLPSWIPVFGGWTWGAPEEVARYLKAFYGLAGWLIISLSILTFSGVLQRRQNQE